MNERLTLDLGTISLRNINFLHIIISLHSLVVTSITMTIAVSSMTSNLFTASYVAPSTELRVSHAAQTHQVAIVITLL